MDTRSKANKNLSKILSIISIIIIFTGYICLSLSLFNAQSIVSYLRSDNMVNSSVHNKKDEVFDLLRSYCAFYNDVRQCDTEEEAAFAKGELQYIEERLNNYAKEGYRYVIRDGGDHSKEIIKDKFSGNTSLSYIFSQPYSYGESYGYNYVPLTEADGTDSEILYSEILYGENTAVAVPMEYFQINVWLNETAVNNILSFESYQQQVGQKYYGIFIFGICTVIAGLILSAFTSHLRNKHGKTEIIFHEKIYNDILLFVYIFVSYFILYLSVKLFRYYYSYPEAIYWLVEVAFGVIFSLLSYKTLSNLTKRAKRGELLSYTLVGAFYRFIKRLFIKTWDYLKESYRIITRSLKSNVKTHVIFISITLIFTVFLGLGVFALFAYLSHRVLIGFFFMVLYFILAAFLITKGVAELSTELEEIKETTEKIRNGELESKLSTNMNPLFGNLPDNLNHIGDGMDKAVKKATASEKVKTELISNVSHDLKTPLTSIISYIEFLDEDESLSPEAKDYVKIIKQKSLRLKNMIADLFDLSKASAIQEQTNLETLGFKQLVNQTVTEMNDKLENSLCPFKLSLPETEIYIKADGKKLYRVLQNLIDNAIKYSLKGTRIFANLYEDNGEAVFEIKNISAYEMNFTSEEILERFKRGDESRSSEGSGLGLSIADTFVKNSGGELNLTIDGDMFKAEVIFKTVNGA